MILMLGDIHSNFAYLKYVIKSRKLTNCTIIQVGDFGIGFLPKKDNEILLDLNDFLKEWSVVVYAIRGNHDDPSYFQGNHIFENIKLLPDYSILELEGHKILLVGGATSVDRKGRLSKMQLSASVGVSQPEYWFDESFVLDEEKLKSIKGIDTVVTHTAPEWCCPDNRNGFGDFVLNFAEYDEYLLEDLKSERDLLTKMFHILKDNGNHIKQHFYGHFHREALTINGMCSHYLLSINQVMQLDTTTEEDYEKLFNE